MLQRVRLLADEDYAHELMMGVDYLFSLKGSYIETTLCLERCCRPPHGELEPHLQTNNSSGWSKIKKKRKESITRIGKALGPLGEVTANFDQNVLKPTKDDTVRHHKYALAKKIMTNSSMNNLTMHVFSLSPKTEVISISKHLLLKVPSS